MMLHLVYTKVNDKSLILRLFLSLLKALTGRVLHKNST